MLRLNQIRDLLTVLDCGSIRGAARALGVSQPAVTKSIRMLEVELGAELLHRTSGGVTPTAAGRAFSARARVAQNELQQARDDVGALGGKPGASLRIGVGSAPAALFAVDAIARYRAEHPDDRILVIEGPGQTLLPLARDAKIDVAIAQRVSAEAAPGLKYRPLLRTSLVVAARRGHPLGSALSLSELHTAQWLVYRPPGSGGVLEEAFLAEGLPLPVHHVHCESLALTLGLILNSDLLGLLVPQMLRHPLARSSLIQLPLARPLPAISIGMYRRADTPVSAAVTSFWSHLTAAAKRVSDRERG
jgi:LysR family transcriptional regulator of abg operon